MDPVVTPRRRLNIATRTAAAQRVFVGRRDGWADDQIGREERLPAKRVRRMVGQPLDDRVLERGGDHARPFSQRGGPARFFFAPTPPITH